MVSMPVKSSYNITDMPEVNKVANALKSMRLSPATNKSKTKKKRSSKSIEKMVNTYFEEMGKYGNRPMTSKERANFHNRFEGLWKYEKGFPRLKGGRTRTAKKKM